MIEKLKNNLAEFQYLVIEEQEFLKIAGKENCQNLQPWGEWADCIACFKEWANASVYRLKPDYQPAKQRKRVSYDVTVGNDRLYRVKWRSNTFYLSHTPSIPGYIGTEFKELPGRLFTSVTEMVSPEGCTFGGDASDGSLTPATPIRVWFLEEVPE